MLEEEKTDSESSCLLFENERRLSERMNYVCRKYTLRSFTGKGKWQDQDDKAYFSRQMTPLLLLIFFFTGSPYPLKLCVRKPLQASFLAYIIPQTFEKVCHFFGCVWLRFVAKPIFCYFLFKNTETQNYHTIKPHGCMFLAIRQNNNTIIDL